MAGGCRADPCEHDHEGRNGRHCAAVLLSIRSCGILARRLTGNPVGKEKANAVGRREGVDEDGAEDGDAVGEEGRVRAPVLPVRRGRHRAEDDNDCDRPPVSVPPPVTAHNPDTRLASQPCPHREREHALSTAPSTQPSSVVCSDVNPNPATMICRWLLSCSTHARNATHREAVSQPGNAAQHTNTRTHTEFVTFLAEDQNTVSRHSTPRQCDRSQNSRDGRKEEEEPRLRVLQALHEPVAPRVSPSATCATSM